MPAKIFRDPWVLRSFQHQQTVNSSLKSSLNFLLHPVPDAVAVPVKPAPKIERPAVESLPPQPAPLDRPLKVGVLTDLEWHDKAGGHVKCWEKFAQAAGELADELDLTLHFIGAEDKTIVLKPNVRLRLSPAVLNTRWIPANAAGPGHSDLAPLKPSLFSQLKHYDVIHCTDVFASAKTALLHARLAGTPVVKSIHTDLPKFTRIYSRDMIRKLSGGGRLSDWLTGNLGLHEWLARNMQRKLERFVSRCDHVLYSREDDLRWLGDLQPAANLSRLRRGIDKSAFNPRHNNRYGFGEWGIPGDRFLLLFAGRVDDSKGAMILARAARRLLDKGYPAHVVFAGTGASEQDIRTLLGRHVTLPGTVSQARLAELYASCDLFVFPSHTETFGNVCLEACSSGMPIVVPEGEPMTQFISRPGIDGFTVAGDDPEQWANTIEPLIKHPEKLARASLLTREHIEKFWPSWKDVLRDDLLAAWKGVFRKQ